MQDPNSSPISWSARFALLLCVSATSITAVDNTAWTDAGIKNGVALAFRDDPVLALREVRATADLPFPAKQIFSLVCDLSQYQSVVPGVQEARLLGGEVPADYEVYLRYAPRFMVVAARDVVLRVQSRAGDGRSDASGRNSPIAYLSATEPFACPCFAGHGPSRHATRRARASCIRSRPNQAAAFRVGSCGAAPSMRWPR